MQHLAASTNGPRSSRQQTASASRRAWATSRVFGRDAPARRRTRQGGERPPAPQHGAARRVSARFALPGGPARVVYHAGQSQSVHPGDGESGLLPGGRLRHDGLHGGRGGTARAECDDAGHRVEHAARVDDPAQVDAGARVRTVDGIDSRRARAANCSSEARRLPPRSVPTSATRRPRRSRRRRSRPASLSEQIVLERGLIEASELDRILSVEAMTRPGIAGEKR